MIIPEIALSDASGVPYYRQIVDQMTQLIRSGQLEPEAQLPSVRDLAAQLLVSLITIRRAYSDLEAAGLIVRKQGHGTYVAGEIESATREQALTEARAGLTELMAQARRQGLVDDDLRTLVNEVLETKGK